MHPTTFDSCSRPTHDGGCELSQLRQTARSPVAGSSSPPSSIVYPNTLLDAIADVNAIFAFLPPLLRDAPGSRLQHRAPRPEPPQARPRPLLPHARGCLGANPVPPPLIVEALVASQPDRTRPDETTMAGPASCQCGTGGVPARCMTTSLKRGARGLDAVLDLLIVDAGVVLE
ncbi:hypothetical protein FOMPIDRAFT_1063344 [Fomitopsis schrenkii]|uniref:Uncharacterized protein n=1 Tax=Fomitopsis schrenkii TaxID=2126942 RepID=S8DMW0_FOMSC|nr:hypothetical protein FOMPIDRAFT_1063344 [Fomitopsis schrenkii]